MTRLLLAVLLCCAGAFSAANARTPFQARCEDSIGATITALTARDAGYSINNTLSTMALTRMKPQVHANRFVLGLTRTEARMSIKLSAQVLGDPASGHECIAPQVEVALSYAPIVRYGGSQFEPGTCAYGEVLTHEMRHLKAYLDHLPKVEMAVRAALKKRFANQPLYAPAGQGKALLEQEINTGWMPYIKKQMGDVERLQAAIDSPQEYARLSKVCKGEVQSLIESHKRNRE